MIDTKIIKHARDCAFSIVEKDPKLDQEKNAGIKNQFLKNYKTMLEFVNIN